MVRLRLLDWLCIVGLKKGIIKSVAQGFYVQPKINSYIGEVLPTVEEVAQVIAKRDRIRLVPSGVYALHALGLSTQIPLNLVFLTDGPARTIKVGICWFLNVTIVVPMLYPA